MAAVHAVALPADLGEGGKSQGISLLLLRGLLIRYTLFQLLYRVGSGQDGGYRRTGEGIVDALDGGESLSRRGQLLIQQVPLHQKSMFRIKPR